jgi:hypothetical protein
MKVFKTKSATRNAILKVASPLTKGFFRDNSWENVQRVWKALEDEGVSLHINDTKYDGDKSKTWSFSAEANGFYFNGSLMACFCGTVTDPTDRYDICFLVY